MGWHFKAAEQGYPEAQCVLGDYYGDAYFGGPRDYSKSLDWYLKAAKQSYFKAEEKMGDIYRLGLGVQVDKSKALEWYSKAADHCDTFGRARIENLMKNVRNHQQQQR